MATAVAAACALPAVLPEFYVFQATQVLIYAIAILGLNLLTGYNGQVSLGHGAFYALGAYTVAILVTRLEVALPLALVAAAAACFAVGFLFGLPALKLEGHYLALATFSLALAIPQLLKYPPLEHWTGGVQGIAIAKPDPPFGLSIGSDAWLYYVCLAVTTAVFVLAANLLRGRVGRAITAIRDQPLAAETMGVNISLYKAATFGISALCTGLAGGLSALIIQFVAPDSFPMFLSIYLLVGAVLGGVASIPGAFLGAAFIVIVPNVASDISKSATSAIYGVLLIAFMYLLPNGAWGAMRSAWGRIAARPPAD